MQSPKEDEAIKSARRIAEVTHARTDREAARVGGYASMTTPYYIPHEQWMLDNVEADMRRGGIDYITVPSVENVTESLGVRNNYRLVTKVVGREVWRRTLKRAFA